MEPRSWQVYAFMTLVAWGVWGVFSKLASSHLRPKQTLLYQALGACIFAVVILMFERFQIQWSPTGASWAFAAGFVNFIGFLTFFAAVQRGKASTIITISALYPVVTIILSMLFLRERITMREAVGIAFALVATVLLA